MGIGGFPQGGGCENRSGRLTFLGSPGRVRGQHRRFVGQHDLVEAICAEQFSVGPDNRAPHRMPEQRWHRRFRGDERFAQVLGKAVYLETEVGFSDSPWPRRSSAITAVTIC